MLILVARKVEAGIDIMGCRGGGGGYLDDIACSDPSCSGYLAEGVEADIEAPVTDDDDVLVDLTWVILSLSPWLLASSLIVSMMETVWT